MMKKRTGRVQEQAAQELRLSPHKAVAQRKLAQPGRPRAASVIA